MTPDPCTRSSVPPLDAARRPRLAVFLLRRYLRAAVIKAGGGPDRSPAAPVASAGTPAPVHRRSR
ncbi:hypothetical protein ABZX98_07560 [Streptomyces sp. NPDC002992]|uniref:hypothetical protein n=1 Tax=Streptomyces sp. NPDC002992 TaxID=3154273 RepID=UPI0033AD859A